MSIRNLDKMFRPQSVAVIGASDKPHSVGSALMTNLTRAGFSGPIIPINPRAAAVHGIMAYKDVASLPITPDLAVIATPPDTIPALMSELGGRGTRAAVILTAGFSEGEASIGRSVPRKCSPPRARICCASSALIVLVSRRLALGSTRLLRQRHYCPATLHS